MNKKNVSILFEIFLMILLCKILNEKIKINKKNVKLG